MLRRWVESALQSVLGAVLFAMIPVVAISYLAKIGSEWTEPLMLGLCGGALIVFIIVAIKLSRRLPPRRLIPTLDNIEKCVRTWLDNFRVTVKVDPVPTAYFRLLVTLDSGIKLHIGRVKEMSDYVLIRASIPPSHGDLERIQALSLSAQNQLLLEIRLELARKNVGYTGLLFPAQDFSISKRVPIRESLTEHEFIAAVEEIEAACHAVGVVYALRANVNVLRSNNNPSLTTSS